MNYLRPLFDSVNQLIKSTASKEDTKLILSNLIEALELVKQMEALHVSQLAKRRKQRRDELIK